MFCSVPNLDKEKFSTHSLIDHFDLKPRKFDNFVFCNNAFESQMAFIRGVESVYVIEL